MGLELSPDSWEVLIAFVLYLLGVAFLGYFSHRYLSRGSFLSEYFLGNRALGGWVLALTVAATAVSGGSFMGFPSLIYTNGWVMALWIASYMVVPLMGMTLMGKRINQVGRITGSVTVPDVLRDRFNSPTLGLLCSLLILFFLIFNLVAQFKAGGLVMKEALLLRPAQAEFLRHETDASGNVVLHFRLGDGTSDTQKTPLPHRQARVAAAVPNAEERHVQLLFDLDGKKLAKTVKYPSPMVAVVGFDRPIDKGYLIGVIIFAVTVIAYTTYGGFWAVTWTDVLEGLVMLAGVLIMAVLAVRAVEPVTTGGETLTGLAAATERLRQTDPSLLTGPGPNHYLAGGMALSFFLMWSLMSAGQPSGMVRLMSFKDTPSLRKALVLVAVYYALTYLALLVIFVCARAIFPTEYLREIGSEGQPDSIMPAMVRYLTRDYAWVGGLLLAAPYAAIMSTVAAFLLLISSSLVRDLYQRTINPHASPRALKIASYLATGLVGVIVFAGAMNPPDFLQYVIVFTGAGMGCSFLAAMLLALYWRRMTRAGAKAAVLGGCLTVLVLYVLGWIEASSSTALREHANAVRSVQAVGLPASPPLARWVQNTFRWVPGWGQPRHDPFAPLYPGGLDPLIYGLLVSFGLAVGVSLLTKPDQTLVDKFFPPPGV